ncbi:hypothetical protein D3C86_975060 [compost metagenome]
MLVHQGAGALGIAGAGRFDEGVVFLRGTTGVVGALIQHGDHGAARGEFAQHAGQHGIAHGLRQQDVEMAEQVVARLHVAAVQRAALFGQVRIDAAVIGGLGASDEFAGERGFQDAAHRIDLAGLVRVGLADECALVGNDIDELVLGQHQQGGADLGAADLVDPGQGLFAQAGAGRKLVRHDGGGHFLGDVVGAGISLNFLGHGARQRLPGGKNHRAASLSNADPGGQTFFAYKIDTQKYGRTRRDCPPAASAPVKCRRLVAAQFVQQPGPGLEALADGRQAEELVGRMHVFVGQVEAEHQGVDA